MNRRPSKRITLVLPSECLDQAERTARQRQVNLSIVVADALKRGLREEKRIRRSDPESYRKAFAGFSLNELLLLDGIVHGEERESRLLGKKDIR